MRQIEQTLIADEELHDLKLRLELLEGDRKAYYETSQWAIRQNKDEIATLRLNVKEMAERVSRLKKSENDPRSSRLSLAKVERFGQKICEVHKRYDDLQADMRNKQDKLQEKMDRLYGLQKESQMMKVEVEDSDNAYEIRNLENRLDRALIKYNEAQSIRKTYEQIVQQLQDERLSFDNQLATFERTLKAKKQDSTELDLMSSDANHARDMAKTELARIDAQILQEREIRSRELQIRKESVKIKMEEREAALLKNVETHETGLDSLKSDEPDGAVDEDREKRVSEFDEILRTVKEVMGVSKLDEVVEKFKSQAETGSHLTSLQTANESRAEALKIRYAEILVEDEKVRFNGESRQTSARRMIEDLERHLSEATIRAQESKNRYEKVAGILRNAKAGVQHSIDKLDGITLDDVPSNLKSADDNFPYILNVATKKLELLHRNVTSRERPVTGSAPVSATTELGSESQQEESGALAAGAISPAISAIEKPITTLLGGPSPIVTVGQAMLPAHNCRVKLRPVEFDERSDGEEEEDVGDEHVPSREMLKKHTTQLLNSKMKKPAKKARKKAKTEKSDGDD